MTIFGNHRAIHYAILTAIMAVVALPYLGASSLWDMDEGVNAECTREMMETGTWIVPTYNYDLRTAKPVMLYWLQRASYNAFGIHEWAARFPSVILSLGTVLIIYELGRRMFSPGVGLLAGVVLASCIEFVKLAHAATPDAAFLFFNTLALAAFWFGQRHGSRAWFVPTAAAAALAVLTKGPAGVALPGLIIVVTLAWNRELHRLWDRRLLLAAAVFLLVAAPWYGLVAAETRGAYTRAFFGDENVNRFMAPKESHSGPLYYYLGAILVFFAPWSVVIGGTVWYGVQSTHSTNEDIDDRRSHRFLMVWLVSYIAFFSFAATKLPNYIAPLYPALALLTASFLKRWASGTLPAWLLPAAAGGLVLMGTVVALGLLIAGGAIPIPAKGLRILPGLAPWAALGAIPIAGAFILLWNRRQLHVAPLTLGCVAVAFVAAIAAFPLRIVDSAKAAKGLIEDSGAKQPDRDIRLASLDYTQESMTFYAERRVERLHGVAAAVDFLAMPRPSYLFVPAKLWDEQIAAQAGPHRIAARRFDHFRNAEILAITNEVQP